MRRMYQVACLSDNDARIALSDESRWEILTKPHGHGDVHMLMHTSGLLDKWASMGIEHVVFFQDTNSLVFRAVPVAIGVSLAKVCRYLLFFRFSFSLNNKRCALAPKRLISAWINR